MARTQPVQVPGDIGAAPETPVSGAADTGAVVNASADVSALQAQLAQLQAQLATAQAAIAEKAAAPALPQAVFEPVTPHGAAARADSNFSHLTVAQLMAKIDAGEVKEPFMSVLCADGYYVRRA